MKQTTQTRQELNQANSAVEMAMVFIGDGEMTKVY